MLVSHHYRLVCGYMVNNGHWLCVTVQLYSIVGITAHVSSTSIPINDISREDQAYIFLWGSGVGCAHIGVATRRRPRHGQSSVDWLNIY